MAKKPKSKKTPSKAAPIKPKKAVPLTPAKASQRRVGGNALRALDDDETSESSESSESSDVSSQSSDLSDPSSQSSASSESSDASSQSSDLSESSSQSSLSSDLSDASSASSDLSDLSSLSSDLSDPSSASSNSSSSSFVNIEIELVEDTVFCGEIIEGTVSVFTDHPPVSVTVVPEVTVTQQHPHGGFDFKYYTKEEDCGTELWFYASITPPPEAGRAAAAAAPANQRTASAKANVMKVVYSPTPARVGYRYWSQGGLNLFREPLPLLSLQNPVPPTSLSRAPMNNVLMQTNKNPDVTLSAIT